MSSASAGPRLALVAIGVVVGLAAAELLVRAFGPSFQVVFRDSISPSSNPVLGYELRPGARDGRYRINTAGLRDREVSTEKPSGTWRIAAIGDSIAYGSGVGRDAAFPKQLEALADAAREDGSPRIEVLNFGVPGYNITQVVERLRERALAFDPDAVIYGYALNDPQQFSIETEALRRLRADLETGTEASALDRALAHSRLYLLTRRIALERRSQAALRADMPNDPAYEAAKRGDRARYFRTIHREGADAARLGAGLDSLAAVARDRKLPVLVVLFPLFEGNVDPTEATLADVHTLVREQAEQRGFAVLDLLPAYAAATRALGSDLSVDFMHPDPVGHRVAGFAILRWLCDHGWPREDALDWARAASSPADAEIARIVSETVSPPSDAP